MSDKISRAVIVHHFLVFIAFT